MNNALPGFVATDVKQLLETAGVASFVSDTGFYQVINGILVQVGRTGVVSSGTVIPCRIYQASPWSFRHPYKQFSPL